MPTSDSDSNSNSDRSTIAVAVAPTISWRQAYGDIFMRPAGLVFIGTGLVLIANMGQVETPMYARLDPRISAAMALAVPLKEFSLSTFQVFSFGVFRYLKKRSASSPVAEDEVAAAFQYGLILAGLLTIPCGTIYLASKPILLLLQQDPELLDTVQSYFQILVTALPAQLGLASFQQIALFKQNPWLIASPYVVQLALSGSLGYLFMFGPPRLEANGYALASVIATYTAFSGNLLFLWLRHRYLFRTGLLRPYFHAFKKIIRRGSEISAMTMAEVLVIFNLTFMTGLLESEASLNAHQVLLRYLYLCTLIMFRLNQLIAGAVGAASTIVNQRRYAIAGISGTIALEAILATILLSAPAFFTNLILGSSEENAEAREEAALALPQVAYGLIPDAARNSVFGVFGGFEKEFVTMLLGLANAVFLSIPLSGILAFVLDQGLTGIFRGRSIALGVIGVVSLAFVVREFHSRQSQREWVELDDDEGASDTDDSPRMVELEESSRDSIAPDSASSVSLGFTSSSSSEPSDSDSDDESETSEAEVRHTAA